MSNKEMAQIPFYAHEGEVTRLERINKRLWIAVLVVFAAFVLSNLAWIIYENQFEDEVYTYEVQQDSGDGGTNTFTDEQVAEEAGLSYRYAAGVIRKCEAKIYKHFPG